MASLVKNEYCLQTSLAQDSWRNLELEQFDLCQTTVTYIYGQEEIVGKGSDGSRSLLSIQIAI